MANMHDFFSTVESFLIPSCHAFKEFYNIFSPIYVFPQSNQGFFKVPFESFYPQKNKSIRFIKLNLIKGPHVILQNYSYVYEKNMGI